MQFADHKMNVSSGSLIQIILGMLILVFYTSAFAATPDQYESDDTFETASFTALKETPPQVRNLHSEDDVDWIGFIYFDATGPLVISAVATGEDTDIVLSLYDEDLTLIATEDSGQFQGEEELIELPVGTLAAGYYYVKIEHSAGVPFGEDNEYTFQVSDGRLVLPSTLVVIFTDSVGATLSAGEAYIEKGGETIGIGQFARQGVVLVSSKPADDASLVIVPNGFDEYRSTVSLPEGLTTEFFATYSNEAVNTPPTAEAQSLSLDQGSSVNIELSGSDEQSAIELLVFDIETPPEHGTLTGSRRNYVYTPEDSFYGNDSFVFSVSDGELSTTAEVDITVVRLNTAPIANDDFSDVINTSSVVIDVLANDTDAEDNIEPSSLTLLSQPASGTMSIVSDKLQYVPVADFTGTVTATYRVSDDLGLVSNVATVSITVSDPPNTPPVAKNDSAETDYDTAITIDVLSNDTDAEDNIDSSTLTITQQPASGSANKTSNNQIRYVPESGFIGTVNIRYRVSDVRGEQSNIATLTIDVVEPDFPPVANSDSAVTSEGAAVVIDVLANDSDQNNDIVVNTLTVVQQPANGKVFKQNGKFTYTPINGYIGADSFTYNVSDATGLTSNTALVTITVEQAQAAPVAQPDSITINQGTTAIVDVLANDSDENNNIASNTLAISTSPENGTASISGGKITYTPNNNFVGEDALSYTVADTTGLTSNQATVTITVQQVASAPTANDDFASVDEDSSINIDVLANDIAGSSSIDSNTLTIASSPSSGLARVSNGRIIYEPNADYNGSDELRYKVSDTSGSASGTAKVNITVISVNDAPSFSSTPISVVVTGQQYSYVMNATDADNDNLQFLYASGPQWLTLNGSTLSGSPTLGQEGSYNVVLTVQDGQGGEDTQSFSLNVTAENQSPIITGTAITQVTVGQLYSFTPEASDPDNDSLTFSIANKPQWLDFSASSGTLTGTPTSDDTGSYAGIRISVSDGINDAVTLAAFTITVNPAPSESVTFSVPASSTLPATSAEGAACSDHAVYHLIQQVTAYDEVDGWLAVKNNCLDSLPIGMSTLTFTASNSNGVSEEQQVSVTVEDITPPEISLNGEPVVYLEAKGSYLERGATAQDKVSGDLSAELIVTQTGVTGTVTKLVDRDQYSEPGNYTTTYTVTDQAGNKAEVSRQIIVVDRLTTQYQYVTPDYTRVQTNTGTPFTLKFAYSTSDNWQALFGLTLNLHYNSAYLQWMQDEDVMLVGLTGSAVIKEDVADLDNDPYTDKYLQYTWTDTNYSWPGREVPELLAVQFQTIAAGNTYINTSRTGDVSRYVLLEYTDYDFVEQRIDISDEPLFSYDLSGDGEMSMAVDGMILSRFIIGYSQDAIFDGLEDELVSTESDIMTMLEYAKQNQRLDINGDGKLQMAVDGTMLLRALTGKPKSAWVTEADEQSAVIAKSKMMKKLEALMPSQTLVNQ